MSPQTVTGQRTGCTLDSRLSTSRAFVHSSLTSASDKCLHCINDAIHPSTLDTSAVPDGPNDAAKAGAFAPAGMPAEEGSDGVPAGGSATSDIGEEGKGR